jgi:hypothetical protein
LKIVIKDNRSYYTKLIDKSVQFSQKSKCSDNYRIDSRLGRYSWAFTNIQAAIQDDFLQLLHKKTLNL